MFTAAALAALAPILHGTTVAQAVVFLKSPAGKVAKRVLIKVLKSIGGRLTPEQQVRLVRSNYAARFARTRRQEQDYIENGVRFPAMVEFESRKKKP